MEGSLVSLWFFFITFENKEMIPPISPSASFYSLYWYHLSTQWPPHSLGPPPGKIVRLQVSKRDSGLCPHFSCCLSSTEFNKCLCSKQILLEFTQELKFHGAHLFLVALEYLYLHVENDVFMAINHFLGMGERLEKKHPEITTSCFGVWEIVYKQFLNNMKLHWHSSSSPKLA